MNRHIEIERHQLSNGDIARITKRGREYQFNILHFDDTAPDCEFNLNKQQAYSRLETTIKNDVLELD
jgi:hypothetical protein